MRFHVSSRVWAEAGQYRLDVYALYYIGTNRVLNRVDTFHRPRSVAWRQSCNTRRSNVGIQFYLLSIQDIFTLGLRYTELDTHIMREYLNAQVEAACQT